MKSTIFDLPQKSTIKMSQLRPLEKPPGDVAGLQLSPAGLAAAMALLRPTTAATEAEDGLWLWGRDLGILSRTF